MDRSTPARQRRIVFEVALGLLRACSAAACQAVARRRLRDGSAVVVQRNVRRYRLRHLLLELRRQRDRDCAVRIQALLRGFLARSLLGVLRSQRARAAEERLSRELGRAWRTHVLRRELGRNLRRLLDDHRAAVSEKRLRSVVAIQRVVRGRRDRDRVRPLLLVRRERFLLVDREARRIQRGLRALSRGRRSLRALVESRAAALIQRFSRHCLARLLRSRRQLGELILRLYRAWRSRVAGRSTSDLTLSCGEPLDDNEVESSVRRERLLSPESVLLSVPERQLGRVLAVLNGILTPQVLRDVLPPTVGGDFRIELDPSSPTVDKDPVVVAHVRGEGTSLSVVLRPSVDDSSVFLLKSLRSGYTLSYRGRSVFFPIPDTISVLEDSWEEPEVIPVAAVTIIQKEVEAVEHYKVRVDSAAVIQVVRIPL